MSALCCATCKRADVRLYRPYGEFFRAERIVCNQHFPAGFILGWWVPCIPEPTMPNTAVGYGAVSDGQCAAFFALPEGGAGPSWGEHGWPSEAGAS